MLDIQGADRAKIGHVLHEANLRSMSSPIRTPPLEDVFMELTQSSVEYGIGAPVPGLGWQHSVQSQASSYGPTQPRNQAPLRAPAQQDSLCFSPDAKPSHPASTRSNTRPTGHPESGRHPMSSRHVVLEPRRHHATFLNSFLSEIRKMAYLRLLGTGHWCGGALRPHYVRGGCRSDYGPSYLDAQAITFSITFLVIFTFAMGGSAVTNEYSSNTMRTTALSDPNRLRSYTAKHVGVFVMVGGVNLVLTLVAILAYMVGAGGSWDFGDGNLRALVMFWLILTTSATMAASLGYIIRSTQEPSRLAWRSSTSPTQSSLSTSIGFARLSTTTCRFRLFRAQRSAP